MRTRPDSFTHPALTAALVPEIERCCLAIGRLDARISVSPVAKPWRLRAAWSGFAKALRLQGVEIDEIDVFAWACGIGIPDRAPRSSAADRLDMFDPWCARLSARDSTPWLEALSFAFDEPQGFDAAPRLLQALEAMRQHARAGDGLEAWLSLPRLLVGLHIARSPLPCLVAGGKALRMGRGLDEALARRVVQDLGEAAERGLERLDDLERDRATGVGAVRDAHRPGKLGNLVLGLLARPATMPGQVARQLGLSLSGASKLLDRAVGLGLVHEISGRRSWKLYVTTEMAIALGLRGRPAGRPRSVAVQVARDPGLAEALARFDAEMAALDAAFPQMDWGGANRDDDEE